jgi:hypothetical protein
MGEALPPVSRAISPGYAGLFEENLGLAGLVEEAHSRFLGIELQVNEVVSALQGPFPTTPAASRRR